MVDIVVEVVYLRKMGRPWKSRMFLIHTEIRPSCQEDQVMKLFVHLFFVFLVWRRA